ncbi:MAG: PEGA domain-containing protein [Leptospiraceae bacterium]|nr:PEGA domain-containing protein [Leptospiraceae bacterium]
MSFLRNRILYLLIVSFSYSCSTIQLQEGLATERQRPAFLRYEPKIQEELTDLTDHRIRKKNKSKATLAISTLGLTKENFDPRIRNFLLEELKRSLAKDGFTSFLLPEELETNSDKQNLFAWLRSKDVDVILKPKATQEESEIKMNVPVLDSVNQKQYGSVDFAWNIGGGNSEPSLKWEIQKTGDRLSTLSPSSATYPKVTTQASNGEWTGIFDLSVKGTVQFYSSSSDTVLTLDGKAIGNTPITKLAILNGPHSVQFSKPGVEPKKLYIHVRAGEERNFYQEWEDDISTASLRIGSVPQGLNVIFDGEMKGQTNQYLSEIAPGDFSIQYTREWEGEEMVFSEGSISLNPRDKKVVTLPYFADDLLTHTRSEFWTTVGRTGFNPGFKPFLLFSSTTSRLVPGDYGYYSGYFFTDNLEIEGSFVNPNENAKGKVSFLVEIGEDAYTYEVNDREVSFYHFNGKSSRSKSIAVWTFKKDDPEKERPFAIETDLAKGMVYWYLGNRKIYESKFTGRPLWRLAILTRGEAFYNGSPLSKLKITYPDLVKFQSKWDKK